MVILHDDPVDALLEVQEQLQERRVIGDESKRVLSGLICRRKLDQHFPLDDPLIPGSVLMSWVIGSSARSTPRLDIFLGSRTQLTQRMCTSPDSAL